MDLKYRVKCQGWQDLHWPWKISKILSDYKTSIELLYKIYRWHFKIKNVLIAHKMWVMLKERGKDVLIYKTTQVKAETQII